MLNRRTRIGRMTARLLALMLLCQLGFAHAGMQALHHSPAVTAPMAADTAHAAGHHGHGDGEPHCAETTTASICGDHAAHACSLCVAACGLALLSQAQAIAPGSSAMPHIAIAAAHFSAPFDSPYRPPARG